jgi:hypothetical protein
LAAAAERGHHDGGQHGRRGCDQTWRPSRSAVEIKARAAADQHVADGNS